MNFLRFIFLNLTRPWRAAFWLTKRAVTTFTPEQTEHVLRAVAERNGFTVEKNGHTLTITMEA